MRHFSSFPAQSQIKITRLVRWDRKTGNALCFADVEVNLNGETVTFRDLKLCQNAGKRPFMSEPQRDYVGDKLYEISDRSLRRQIELALIHAYTASQPERKKPQQLTLFTEVTP